MYHSRSRFDTVPRVLSVAQSAALPGNFVLVTILLFTAVRRTKRTSFGEMESEPRA